MSVTYNTTLKNTRLNDVVAAIDTGGAGYLEIVDALMAHVLTTIHFNSVCGTVTGGVLTFLGTPLVDASAARTCWADTPSSRTARMAAATLAALWRPRSKRSARA